MILINNDKKNNCSLTKTKNTYLIFVKSALFTRFMYSHYILSDEVFFFRH